jgi:hypothetical protein
MSQSGRQAGFNHRFALVERWIGKQVGASCPPPAILPDSIQVTGRIVQTADPVPVFPPICQRFGRHLPTELSSKPGYERLSESGPDFLNETGEAISICLDCGHVVLFALSRPEGSRGPNY